MITWAIMMFIAVGVSLMICCESRWGWNACRRSSQAIRDPQTEHTASRFLPGFLTGVLGSLLVVGVTIGVMRLGMARAKTAKVAAYSRQFEIDSKQEFDRMPERVNEGASTPRMPIPVTAPRETEANLPSAEPELGPRDSADQHKGDDPLDVTVFAPYALQGTQVAELPEWTSRTGESGGLPRVVSSGHNARPIGAMADAFTRLSRRLSKELVREHPEAAGWVPKFSDSYRIGVIGRRAVQQTEVTVGQFTEPMYQEFIEVVPPADLDARLFNLWRADTVNSRLLVVGGAIGMLTLLFGSLAGYFRVNAALRGKYRNALLWGTAVLGIAAGSALMLVA